MPNDFSEGMVLDTYDQGFGGKDITQIEVISELSQLAVLVNGEIFIFKIIQEDKPRLELITSVNFLTENPPDITHFFVFSAFVNNSADKSGKTSIPKAVLVAICSKEYIYCVWDGKAGNYRVQYEIPFPDGMKPEAVHVYKGFMIYGTKKGYYLQTQKGYFPIPVKGDLTQKFIPSCSIVGSTGNGQIDVVCVVGNQLNYLKVSEPSAAAIKSASEQFGAQASQNILCNAVVTPINILPIPPMTKDVRTHLPFVISEGHNGSCLLYFGNTVVTTFNTFEGKFNCSFIANYMNQLVSYSDPTQNQILTSDIEHNTLNEKGGLNVLIGLTDLSSSSSSKYAPGMGKSVPGSKAESDIMFLVPKSIEDIANNLAEPLPQDRDKIKFTVALDIASYSEDSFKLQSHINALYGYYLYSLGAKEINNAMTKFLESKCDPRCILRLVKGLIRDNIGMQIAMREGHPKTDDIDIFDIQAKASMKNQYLSAMISYIMKWRNLHLEDSNNALHNLSDIESQNEFDTVLMKTVDTALLKCFIMQDSGVDALVSFLTLPNHCDLKECETLLDNEKFCSALVILYKSNGMHDEALDKLCKRNKWLEAITYLVDMGGGPANREELMKDPNAAKTLHPESYYVDVHRKYTKLIFKTLLESNEAQCLTIYFAPVPENVVPIDRRNGLEILQSVGAKDTTIMHFLDHVLLEDGEANADKELHNAMVRCSVSMLNEYCKLNGLDGRFGGANKVNKTSGIYPTNPAPRAGTEDGDLGEIRKKLVQFLRKSDRYDLKDSLTYIRRLFPKGLLEEKAMIHIKMHDYETALRILAIKLSNAPLAERACADIYTDSVAPGGFSSRAGQTERGGARGITSVYASSSNDGSHIYNILMNVYLKPFPNNPTAVPYTSKIIQLLSTHWQKMSPSNVITSLSKSEIRISEIEDFLKNHYLSLNGDYRMLLIKKAALQARLLNLKEHKNALLNHSVTVDKDTICPVCKDYIYSSAIVVYPNGRLVHRMCAANERARAVVQDDKERGWRDVTAEPYFN